MKIAEQIIAQAPAHNDTGFRPEPEWKEFVSYAVCEAEKFEVDCPESEDSSLSLEFSDGSAVRIDNPGQRCFSGQVS